jgi:hypothetical protein
LALIASPGCVTVGPRLPPLQRARVGPHIVEYRDYSKHYLCDQPLGVLRRELDRLNGILHTFISATSQSVEQPWPDDDVAMLTDAQHVLPQVLEAHAFMLRSLNKCNVDPGNDLLPLFELGLTANEKAWARLEQAPRLLVFAKAHQAVAHWHRGLPERQAAVRQARCEGGNGRRLYYTSEENSGRRELLFCDGTRVVTSRTGPTELVPPQFAPTPPEWLKSKYLQATTMVRADQLDRSPRVPSPASVRPLTAQPAP